MQRTIVPFASLALVAIGAHAHAQHAELVLFGESNEAGLALAPERRHVHPLTAPFYAEDSFVTSDVRVWYLYHSFPSTIALDGGNAKAYAAQVRLALTDRLQFVAYKDGWLELDTGLIDDEGLVDLAAGIKWNFLQDWENDTHAAVGLGYELGIGDDDVLQDDDELRLWGSFNQGFDRLHVGGTANFLFATDSEDALGDADRASWHLHADYWINEQWSPVVEFNGYHVLDEGDNTPLPFSGVDVANLGGGSSEGVVTSGVGFEFRALEDLAFRAAYEFPLTDNEDLFGYRWTASAVWAF